MATFLAILPYAVALFSAGGLVYMAVEKWMDKKLESNRDKAEVKAIEIENSNKTLELYKEITSIIEANTAPLKDKINEMDEKLDRISKYVCTVPNCKKRRTAENLDELKTVVVVDEAEA